MLEYTINEIQGRLKRAEDSLVKVKELLEIAAEAGEDVTSLLLKYEDVEKRIARWKTALRTRGYE